MTLSSARNQKRIAQSRRLRVGTWSGCGLTRPQPQRPSCRLQRLCWTDPNMHRAPRTVGSITVRMEAWRTALILRAVGSSTGDHTRSTDLSARARRSNTRLARTARAPPPDAPRPLGRPSCPIDHPLEPLERTSLRSGGNHGFLVDSRGLLMEVPTQHLDRAVVNGHNRGTGRGVRLSLIHI